ncbi:conserved hypothetical protein [Microsporum canis CBS 113480]|uniref:Uncharacterized protein n=1 Tax=Arthroderma otae (strain ATCC MYA-4605 / CBS 113480) TaxID=554155 RepID=C5FJH3_ARTOC|nr:conserved hypothetical protein [Microsporum canis CBS 113480]EEQ30834.1 conserved hypothetical protein [Microsporum canis CBS 113480]
MAPKKHINWKPFTQKVLEKWATSSLPNVPSARHCTIGHPSRLRESGTHAVAFFYLVTAADPGPWYVIDSVLWDTEKNSKLCEATFIVPCRDPPSARHPFVCEWDEGLRVYVVRHYQEPVKELKNEPKAKESKKDAEEKGPAAPSIISYDGASDEPETWSPGTANEHYSLDHALDIKCLPPLPDDYLDDGSLYEPGEAAALEKDGEMGSQPSTSSVLADNVTDQPSQMLDGISTNPDSVEDTDTDVTSLDLPESAPQGVYEEFNAADYEYSPPDTDLSEEALKELRWRVRMCEEYPEIHHYNFFGEAMAGPTFTPPEVSLFVLLQGPKSWSSDASVRASVLRRAIRFIDPILYTGPVEALSYHGCNSLIKAITGNVHRFYTIHGSWTNDDGRWAQARPILDPTDPDIYYTEPWLPINGWLNVHWRLWSRDNYRNGMREMKPMHKKNLAPVSKSPLSKCMLASEF